MSAVTAGEPAFEDIYRSDEPAETAYVYEHGWQSWSPAGLYPATTRCSPRPQRHIWQAMAFRPEKPAPPTGFQGEGLLAVVQRDGAAAVFLSPEPDVEVASIRARVEDGRVVVSTDGPVMHFSADSLDDGLRRAAHILAHRLSPRPLVALPPGWCSWYAYWNEVTAADIIDNLNVIVTEDLPTQVVQVDDGYQAGIGDWLTPRPGFGDLDGVVRRIVDAGRVPGVWTAPFLVGARSELAGKHPDWLVDGAIACEHHWGQEIRVLDVTHPDAAEHLRTVFATLRERGFAFHKIDFVYAGAMEGSRYEDVSALEAYRRGLNIVREGVGTDAVILGCGAPLLPSIGMVDTMRISPDIMPAWEPDLSDISQPGMRSALAAGRARAWMHGQLWVNDPDCILVRTEVEQPDAWRQYLRELRGLAVSSDPLPHLDRRRREQVRELMLAPDLSPVTWDPWAGPDQGLIHRETTSR